MRKMILFDRCDLKGTKMKYLNKVLFHYVKSRVYQYNIRKWGKESYFAHLKKYAGKNVCSSEEISVYIQKSLQCEEKVCIARFGASELFCASMFEFDVDSKKKKAIEQLNLWSGFFPADVKYGDDFNRCIIEASKNVDILAIWAQRFEEYYIKKYMKNNLMLTYLYNIEPWKCPHNPWTRALKGKKVLVIHPFESTIIRQYQKRDKLFPGTEILPDFDLKTLKAVQTVAGVEDKRFDTWYEALDFMYEEAVKIDFDIAILGCGAYGLPLASKLKDAGKHAIHLGGATQILFGIKGKRWDEDEDKAYVRAFYNDAWVYPDESERPQNANVVEGGCYW